MPWPPPFLWPLLTAAANARLASDVVAAWTPSASAGSTLRWTTKNQVVAEFRSLRLRRFSGGGESRNTLIVAPFSLHNAKIADFAHHHSLVAALSKAGCGPLYLIEWRSASPSRRLDSIDTLLADVDAAIDQIGGKPDLIGICQGGWMSVVYAARFPGKVGKLVIAGAPIDLDAAETPFSMLARMTPRAAFTQVVEHGGGLSRGLDALAAWGRRIVSASVIAADLQVPEAPDTQPWQRLAARFQNWHATVVDLPGVYYLQVVDWLYRENRLAKGQFVALGRTINLADLKLPMLLLAARDDQIVSIGQLLSLEQFVATPPDQMETIVVDGPHLSLFMGRRTLDAVWPTIAAWLQR